MTVEVTRVTTAFETARLLACNDSCGRCGKFKRFPEGVAILEEPYCEAVWLCEECYPDIEADDEK